MHSKAKIKSYRFFSLKFGFKFQNNKDVRKETRVKIFRLKINFLKMFEAIIFGNNYFQKYHP
jgi:hypothetical protein